MISQHLDNLLYHYTIPKMWPLQCILVMHTLDWISDIQLWHNATFIKFLQCTEWHVKVILTCSSFSLSSFDLCGGSTESLTLSWTYTGNWAVPQTNHTAIVQESERSTLNYGWGSVFNPYTNGKSIMKRRKKYQETHDKSHTTVVNL